ncbi:hypothetical protein [Candidatus Nanohalovita haloferacivicina]|uniref:hypothetical protein n=1 Tax=Candidatus Nanohalovita haloferacivicina TaxID=2978046 RepID=UPI00325FD402
MENKWFWTGLATISFGIGYPISVVALRSINPLASILINLIMAILIPVIYKISKELGLPDKESFHPALRLLASIILVFTFVYGIGFWIDHRGIAFIYLITAFLAIVEFVDAIRSLKKD